MNKLKRALAALLACVLLLSCAAPALAGEQVTKNEIVYATYDADGGNAAYSVVNRFELNRAQEITDYGVYQQVTNLTSTAPIRISGDEITVQADAGVFYYEGVLSRAELPWLISIEYRLNGTPISPANLAGRSGPVEITLRVRRNSECAGDYFDHYALSITAAFDEENCESIEAANGIVASAGSKKQVSFTVVPGSEADLTITMDAVQFAMDPITINGVPMSMDVGSIDTSELKEQMTDLEQGAVDLDDGVNELRDGVTELAEGTDELSSGSGQVSRAMNTLRAAADSLREADAQVVEGMQELADAAALLESYHAELLAGTGALTDSSTQNLLAQANAGLDAYADPNTGLPAKGEELCAGVRQMADAMSPLTQALSLVADFITELDAIAQGIAGCGEVVKDLPDASDKLDKVIGLLNSAKSDLSAIMTPIARAQIDSAINMLTAVRDRIEAVEKAFGNVNLNGFLNRREELLALASSLREKANEMNEALNGQNGLVAGTEAYVAAVNDYIALVSAYQDGMNQINDGTQELCEGVESYLAGTTLLYDGVDELNTSYAEMSDGIQSFTSGVRKLASNYASLDEGIQSLVDGVTELADGVDELASGTLELRDSTSGAGDRVDDEVNKALDKFKNEDYVAPSFVSDKNEPTLVQFVIKYKGVTLPDKAKTTSVETDSSNADSLDKLRDLLGG